jgi:hypothetical protein
MNNMCMRREQEDIFFFHNKYESYWISVSEIFRPMPKSVKFKYLLFSANVPIVSLKVHVNLKNIFSYF